jgi:hypothetical protein
MQRLVGVISPTPAEVNARAQALRQNKTLRAADVEGEVKFQFLAGAADAEPKRVIYDSAAANTLVSKDIALCKTGLSGMEFVGISGDNVKGGDVGSATVVTTDEYVLGRPVVIPVTEAHTMDPLQKGTVLLCGFDVYNKGGTVIICGETKRCEYWLPRRDDGTRDKVGLRFKDRVLQLESDPAAVVPGIVTSDEWAAPTMGISQRKGGAERLSVDSFCTPNIFMALEGEKKKKNSAGKAGASVKKAPVAVQPNSQNLKGGGECVPNKDGRRVSGDGSVGSLQDRCSGFASVQGRSGDCGGNLKCKQ